MSELQLSENAMAQVAQFAERLAAEEAHFRAMAELLDGGTDDEIIAFAEAQTRLVTVTLASTYRDKRPDDWKRELHCVPSQLRGHPRRPVMMRGAKDRMVVIHRAVGQVSDNGYAAVVIARYLRSRRFTSFDHSEINRALYDLRDRLGGKYNLCSRGECVPYITAHTPFRAFVSGQSRDFTDHQFNYLKKLHLIIRKTERLDRQSALLTKERVEPMRLAA